MRNEAETKKALHEGAKELAASIAALGDRHGEATTTVAMYIYDAMTLTRNLRRMGVPASMVNAVNMCMVAMALHIAELTGVDNDKATEVAKGLFDQSMVLQQTVIEAAQPIQPEKRTF